MPTDAPLADPGAARVATGLPAVRLAGLRKSFGSLAAVAGVDLEIGEGEFFTMLGPSGSGKTTLLRLIAGFERPDSGTVELGGADVTRQPPYARNVNTVFQDYALFPHMNVLENVEYGLRVHRVPRAERRRRAEAALEMVRLARGRRLAGHSKMNFVSLLKHGLTAIAVLHNLGRYEDFILAAPSFILSKNTVYSKRTSTAAK